MFNNDDDPRKLFYTCVPIQPRQPITTEENEGKTYEGAKAFATDVFELLMAQYFLKPESHSICSSTEARYPDSEVDDWTDEELVDFKDEAVQEMNDEQNVGEILEKLTLEENQFKEDASEEKVGSETSEGPYQSSTESINVDDNFWDKIPHVNSIFFVLNN